MQKFENVNLVYVLRQIMNTNTDYYKNDFEYDIKTMSKAAVSNNPDKKRLLFMSRPKGTYCFRESEVFTKDTFAHNAWKFYGQQTDDKILAYAIEITDLKTDCVIGNLYELDYTKHFNHVINVSVNPDDVSASEELKFTLSCEHKRLEKLKCGDISKYIDRITARAVKEKLAKMTQDEKQGVIDTMELAFDYGMGKGTLFDVELYNAIIKERSEEKPSIKKQLAENKGKSEPTKSKTPKKEDISL